METDTSSAQSPVCPNRWSTNMTSWNMGFARSQETHVDSVGSRLQEISHKTQRGKRGNNWHITIHSLLFVYYLNPSRIVCILCALISWFQYMSQLHKRLTATFLFAFTLECTKQKRLECDNQDRKQIFFWDQLCCLYCLHLHLLSHANHFSFILILLWAHLEIRKQ